MARSTFKRNAGYAAYTSRRVRDTYDTTKAAAMCQEALDRARAGLSMANYQTIFEGFAEKGIPVDQVEPRVNVFTYEAWRAQGRQVRRGEHGVKVVTWVEATPKEDPHRQPGEVSSRDLETRRFPKTTTVFHVSQTSPIGE